MGLLRTKIFQSGGAKAVLLPDEIEFGIGTEVVIESTGEAVRIVRAPKMTNQELIAKLRSMPKPPEIEERDIEEIPEREGL
jgi:antitoxin VapB